MLFTRVSISCYYHLERPLILQNNTSDIVHLCLKVCKNTSNYDLYRNKWLKFFDPGGLYSEGLLVRLHFSQIKWVFLHAYFKSKILHPTNFIRIQVAVASGNIWRKLLYMNPYTHSTGLTKGQNANRQNIIEKIVKSWSRFLWDSKRVMQVNVKSLKHGISCRYEKGPCRVNEVSGWMNVGCHPLWSLGNQAE